LTNEKSFFFFFLYNIFFFFFNDYNFYFEFFFEDFQLKQQVKDFILELQLNKMTLLENKFYFLRATQKKVRIFTNYMLKLMEIMRQENKKIENINGKLILKITDLVKK
jgi:hypothetical protein